MSTVTVETVRTYIADNKCIRQRMIRDKIPKKKQGVSGYCITAYMWGNRRRYIALIECCWLCNKCIQCSTLHKASEYIRKYMYQENKETK